MSPSQRLEWAVAAALCGFVLIVWLVQAHCADLCAPYAPDMEPTGCYCNPSRVSP